MLVVEHEPVARMMLEVRLRAMGCTVVAAASGEAALALLCAKRFALLITELHFDSMDGVALMAQSRSLDPELELIVLTGGATLESAIAAVEYGVHTYMRKPVAVGELEQRAAAALERHRSRAERATALLHLSVNLRRIAEPQAPTYRVAEAQAPSQQIGLLGLDTRRRQASVSGRPVPLSRGEFDLLLCLAQHAGQVVSPEQLMREVFHYSCTRDEARSLVKSHVHRLRHKIEPEPQTPTLLISVRGAGYMLATGN